MTFDHDCNTCNDMYASEYGVEEPHEAHAEPAPTAVRDIMTKWYRPNLHGGGTSTCWICGEYTEWVDTQNERWQHPDCDSLLIVGGKVVV